MYTEPGQTSKMEHFAKIVKGLFDRFLNTPMILKVLEGLNPKRKKKPWRKMEIMV